MGQQYRVYGSCKQQAQYGETVVDASSYSPFAWADVYSLGFRL